MIWRRICFISMRLKNTFNISECLVFVSRPFFVFYGKEAN